MGKWHLYFCETRTERKCCVSSRDRCGSEFIGTINVGAEPEERTGENRKEEQENEEDGRTPICIHVHVYIYICVAIHEEKERSKRNTKEKSK